MTKPNKAAPVAGPSADDLALTDAAPGAPVAPASVTSSIPTMTSAAKSRKMWAVFDSNAIEAPRRHEAAPKAFYNLSATAPTPMPREHALVFLADPSFIVHNETGARVPTLPKVSDAKSDGSIILMPGQVVAGYVELTDGALMARCARYPGHEMAIESGERDQMVEFLETEAHKLRRGIGRSDTETPAQRAAAMGAALEAWERTDDDHMVAA